MGAGDWLGGFWRRSLSRLGIQPAAAPDPRPRSNPQIALLMADVAKRRVDAIVNAADWTMLGGTGVDGAVHEGAGPELGRWIAARRMRLEPAQAVATPGFDLPALHVIHACAPTFASAAVDEEAARAALALTHRRCVELADAMGLSTLSVPLLGEGAFGWPTRAAAEICVAALREAAAECRSLKRVEICAFGERACAELERALGASREPGDDPSTLRHHAGASALSGLSAEEIENVVR